MKISGYKKSNNNNKKLIIAIVAAVAVVAIIVGLIVGLSSKKPDDKKDVVTTKPTTTTTAKPAVVVGISIDKLPNKIAYVVGDEFDGTGLSVKVEMSDPAKSYFVDANDPDLQVVGFDTSIVRASHTVYLEYKGFRTSFEISVNSKDAVVEGTVTGIQVVSTPKTTYFLGEEFDQSAIVISVVVSEKADPYYVKGTDPEVIVTGFDSSVASELLTLTVTYREFTTTYDITVVDPATIETVILSLHIVKYPERNYVVGQPFYAGEMQVQVVTNNIYTYYFIDATDPELEISGFDSSEVAENQVITVTYRGVSTTFTVNIKPVPTPAPTLVSFEVVGLTDTYTMGVWNENGVSLYGAKLKLIYSDDSTEEVKLLGKYVSSLPVVTEPGTITITITYSGIVVEVPITITE